MPSRDEEAVAPTLAADSGGVTAATDAIAPSRRIQMIAPGTAVGRYVIAERLGWGGMGVVYRARDPRLGREVALKLVVTSGDIAEAQRRLEVEAQAMAKLDHPNVVGVHDIGAYGEQLFIAMELCSGGSLARWIKQPQAWRAIVERFIAAGRGLAAAHHIGLVHRDFKPDNVLISESGAVKVSDFGLVREGSEVTEAIEGTPSYMAPEQLELGIVDARADQFAFGVSLWEALSGERPFVAESGGDILEATLRAIRERAFRGTPRAPKRVIRIVERSLAAVAAERFPTLDAMLDALEAALSGSRLPFAIGAGVIAAGAIGIAAFALTRPPPVDATLPDKIAAAIAPALAIAGERTEDPQAFRLALAASHDPRYRLGLGRMLVAHGNCTAMAELDHYAVEAKVALASAMSAHDYDQLVVLRADCAADPSSTMDNAEEIEQLADRLERTAPDQAILALKHALRIAPTSYTLYLKVGDYSAAYGDCTNARLAYTNYLELAQPRDADAIRQRIDSCKD